MISLNNPPQKSSELEFESEPQSTDVPQQTSKKSKLPGWLLAILLLGGSAALWQIFNPNSAPTAQTTTQTPPPKSVETVALAPGTGNRQIRLLGQVEASNSHFEQ